MKGYYTIHGPAVDPTVINNIITENGKSVILNYMAGHTYRLASHVCIGVGAATPTSADQQLQFELARGAIVASVPDYANKTVTWLAEYTPTSDVTLYEYGLVPSDDRLNITGIEGLYIFSELTAGWNNGVPASGGRCGATIDVTANASQTKTASASAQIDFSRYLDSAAFSFARVSGSNCSALKWRFKTDASNYYTFTESSPAPGWGVITLNRTAAVATGSPAWSSINSVELEVVASSSGQSVCKFEALRVEDTSVDFQVMSRATSAGQPLKAGATYQISYTLDLSL